MFALKFILAYMIPDVPKDVRLAIRRVSQQTFCLLCWLEKPFPKGSTLEGKNLLLQEQILSFKS